MYRSALACFVVIVFQACAVWRGWQPIVADKDNLYKGWSVWIRADQSPGVGCGVFVWMLMREISTPPSVRIMPDSVCLLDSVGNRIVDGSLRVSINYPYRMWRDSVSIYEMFGDRDASACLDSVALPNSLICRLKLVVLNLQDRSVSRDSVDIPMTYRKGIYFTGGV